MEFLIADTFPTQRWDQHDSLLRRKGACTLIVSLMSNHYHLVVETPNANLVAGMAWLQSSYTIRLNHHHKLIGHVLSGRYKAQLRHQGLQTACSGRH